MIWKRWGQSTGIDQREREVTLTTHYLRQQCKEGHSSAAFCDLWMMGNRSLKRDDVLGVTAMPSR